LSAVLDFNLFWVAQRFTAAISSFNTERLKPPALWQLYRSAEGAAPPKSKKLSLLSNLGALQMAARPRHRQSRHSLQRS
jgi:hypothetical protein